MRLTEQLVTSRSKHSELHTITRLNVWGSELTDISIVKEMPAIEILALSVNNISSLRPFRHCKKLRELYLRKNNIKSFDELRYLQNLPELKFLWLEENPCQIRAGSNYRMSVLRILPHLLKLDDRDVTEEERVEALHENESYRENQKETEENLEEETDVEKMHAGAGGDGCRHPAEQGQTFDDNSEPIDLRSLLNKDEERRPRGKDQNIEVTVRNPDSGRRDNASLKMNYPKAKQCQPEAFAESENSFSDNETNDHFAVDSRSFDIAVNLKAPHNPNEESYKMKGGSAKAVPRWHSMSPVGKQSESLNNTQRSNGDGNDFVGAEQRSRRITSQSMGVLSARKCEPEVPRRNALPRMPCQEFLDDEERAYPVKNLLRRRTEAVLPSGAAYDSSHYRGRHSKEPPFHERCNYESEGRRRQDPPMGAGDLPRRYDGYEEFDEDRRRAEARQQRSRHHAERKLQQQQRQQEQQQKEYQQRKNDHVVKAMKYLSETLEFHDLLEFDDYLRGRIEEMARRRRNN